MEIDTDLDGGSIETLGVRRDGREVELALRSDSHAEFRQWFCFRARGAPGRSATLRIVNASAASFPGGFEGYRACASPDGERWYRVPTTFDGEQLTIRHDGSHPAMIYAYFAPYPLERRARLLARVAGTRGCAVETLGASVQGRALSVAIIGGAHEARPPSLLERDDDGDGDDDDDDGESGEGDGRRRIWIVARQHPGETMAEWFADGLLERLLDPHDAAARAARERAVFCVAPCANPDGAVLGNQRTNGAGVDLNRTWLDTDAERAPETALLRAALEARGVDLFLDVHGDEATPYCFAAGCEGNPSYDERIDALEDRFMESLCARDRDFQREFGYPLDGPGEGDLRTAANFVGEAFDCLSLTLEMPFKDAANNPDPSRGFTPARARRLGHTVLEAVLDCLDDLR